MEGKRVQTKRKRYSKHVKKNQRKFTNVKDFEQYLEEARRDERTGGAFADKPDEELFCIERDVDLEVNAKGVRHKRLLRSETRFTESRIQGFKPIKKKRRSNTQLQNGMIQDQPPPPQYVDSSEDEEYDTGKSFKQLLKDKKQLEATAHSRTAKPRIKIASHDLWADEGNEVVPQLDSDNLYFETARMKPIKKPGTVGTKPSALENLEMPHPGMSYNPVFEDHQDLVRTAVEVEEDKLKEEDKLARKLKLTPMTAQQREQVWLQEMSEGLFEDITNGKEDEGGDQEAGAELPLATLKRPVRAEDRKTHQQRRKEKLRREEERRRKVEKLEKARAQAIYRLRSVRREMREKEEKMMENIRKRQEEKAKAMCSTKRLGRYSYQEPDIDVQLSTDIAQSLRVLKPEGSIALDRFKSLQKRNIIEPRERSRLKRKYRIKIKEKRSARLEEDESRTITS
ncbi:hypothetical protein EMCRGX_G032704 [Ephydatia muelleri]